MNQVSRNDYLKLIDIVTDRDTASPLTTWLAKSHPFVLLEFHGHGDCAKYAIVVAHLKANAKVAAIKELRTLEGLGLLEAKRCCDYAIQDTDYGIPDDIELSRLNVLGIGEVLRRAFDRGF